MERKNILKLDQNSGELEKISATEFVNTVCSGNESPLVRLVNGYLFQEGSSTYCLNSIGIELDNVAQMWMKA